jgi:nitrate reductase assembly molybdenum cofactor insertion protein NarJ
MNTILKINKQETLVAADLFRLLSRGFSYPDEQVLRDIKVIGTHLISTDTITEMQRALLSTILSNFNEEEIRTEYSRVFLRGGVAVAESHYTPSFTTVAEVNAFYSAFGFSPKSGEVPDSLMYELEFIAILLLKSVLAENPEHKEVVDAACIKFIDEHVKDFSRLFVQRINSGDANVYLKSMTSLLALVMDVKENEILN